MTDAVTAWTTSTAGLRTFDGIRLDEAFAATARKLARKQIEAAIRKVDWASAMTDPAADDQVRNAIRSAKLAN